jgi:glyoxylase-like metal-dependent hydrolase (beta-lactamase superfamily II)
MSVEQTRSTGKPVAEIWYAIDAHDNDVIRFREDHIDSFAVGDIWLVRGRDRDLVVDTGSGIISPAPLVEAVAGKPVTAVALNCYFDHAGGWHSFLDRACHPHDAPDLENPNVEDASVSNYLNDTTMWSLPWEGYEVESFAMTPAKPTRLVEDGDTFDLGNRTLEVLHVPGRSFGKPRRAACSPAICSMTGAMAWHGRRVTRQPIVRASGGCMNCRLAVFIRGTMES